VPAFEGGGERGVFGDSGRAVLPVVMNGCPKKAARHSLLAINCETKGIKCGCGIVRCLANFVTQPEVVLNMEKVEAEKAKGKLSKE